MSEPTGTADTLGPPVPVLSVSPVVLSAPDRAVDLRVRVSAPVTGSELPILLLSHGQGHSNHLSSLNGYAPLVDFWAAHGFVVIQPTHLSSTSLNLDSDAPDAPMHWRSRAEDMTRVLDRLDEVEAAVPQLLGRLDRDRVAVAGHSMGGHTASLLLGARLTDPHDGTEVDLAEPRIRAGVLLATTGGGGDALTGFVAENYPFLLTSDFSGMRTPALVVAGDKDASAHLTVRGPEWHADPYFLSPGPKSLLTLFGAEHGLGGISGYDVAETTDESPERVSAVQRLTWAYLRTELYPGDPAWREAREALASDPHPLGRVESR
ncbi:MULTISPECIES: alpha/beta hydrolase family protein [Nocardiopsis]|jgi:predicted dienelactone hydrolase|uniref:Chlorophyllase n=1 Tax=Nocardiopsis sinuspersici TaxID=501010 RepID=A0A1V3C786_9ACTN|nr:MULTISPECIES: chlorophyllase [Nocardiopsis]OOC56621.1 chlorophyllase [Nocardiopsis sinuspersici]